MKHLRRAFCLFAGHAAGGSILFRYRRVSRERAQRPDLRGPVTIQVIGTECPRCGFVEAPGPETAQEVVEMVDGMIGRSA